MKTLLGRVESLQGKFYVQDANGHVKVLSVGDEIHQGERVFGDASNTASNVLQISSDAQETLVLTGANSLVFDMSTNEATFGNEEVAFPSNSPWLQVNNPAAPIDEQALAQTDAGDITNEETAAGNEAPRSNDTGVFGFANRDGNAVDISSGLRDTTFSDTTLTATNEGILLQEEAYDVIVGLTGLDVNEDETGSNFTLTLSNPTTAPATLVVNAGGTTYTYTIPTGSTSYTFEVPTQDSDVYVDLESLIVSVESLTGGGYDSVDITGASATVGISDTIDITTVTLSSGNVSEDAATVTFTVQLANAYNDYGGTASVEVNGVAIPDVAIDSTGKGTFTVNTQDSDAIIDGQTVSAVVTGLSRDTQTTGGYEKVDYTNASASIDVTDTIDTTVLTVNESYNSTTGVYTYTANVTNAPDQNSNLVITLSTGAIITLTYPNTTESISIPTQADSIISVSGGNYEDLDAIYGFGQDIIMVNAQNNALENVDLNASHFDSDAISNELSINSITLHPQVDTLGYAVNAAGDRLTSTDFIGTSNEEVYYIKYDTSDANNIVAYRVENDGTSHTDEVVFTISSSATTETYSVQLGTTYLLDGAGYTEAISFNTGGNDTGGRDTILVYNMGDLYIVASATQNDTEAKVNYSVGNGLGVLEGAAIDTNEVLTLNFTDSTQVNEKYVTDAEFTLKKWGSKNDQASWKAYNGTVLIADGISTDDIVNISSEVSNVSITNGVTWDLYNNVYTNNSGLTQTANVSYTVDAGGTTLTTSITLEDGESFDFNAFNEVQFTALSDNYTVYSMSASTSESVPPENQIINIGVETSDGTNTATGIMQLTLDGDGAIGGTDQDEVISYTDATFVDGGDGYDTLALSGGTIDFDGIQNIEEIDLSASGINEISITVDNVVSMTDADNIIKITGTSNDKVTLDSSFAKDVDLSNDDFNVYTYSDADKTVQVQIQTDIETII